MDSNLTPEEKLLKIIETPKGGAGAGRSMRAPMRISFSYKALWNKWKPIIVEHLKLKTINYALFALAMLFTLYAGLDFWLGIPSEERAKVLEEKARSRPLENIAIVKLFPLELYLQEVVNHNIFALTPAKEEVVKNETTAAQENKKALIKDLKIVGIIWSSTPQVMIEDVTEGENALVK